MKVKRIDEQTFGSFADAHPNSNIWQTLEMGKLQQLEGRSTDTLGIYDDQKNELKEPLSWLTIL